MSLDPRRIAAARLWAAHRYPYLATALFATRIVQVPGTGAVAVDPSWRLYVDPEVVAPWTVEQLGSVLVHHSGHLLRDHAGRANDFGIGREQAHDWTLACDAEVNDDLPGLQLPGEPVTPSKLGFEDGRFAEEYYRRLQQDEQPDVGDCDCGSGTDSHGRGWDLPRDDDGAPGLKHGEANLLRCQVASDILREARGKKPGAVPLGLQRWAESLLEPKIDWRHALAAEVRRGIADTTGRVDYSYRRPSRRASVSKDVVLPAMRRPVPNVTVVVDTSGSMDERQLGLVLSEIEGIVRGLGLRQDKLRVLSCDATVHKVQRVASAKQVQLFGGGGTNMGAGIDAAVGARPRPSVVVVLTDGLTPWPAVPPKDVKVVVGLLGHEAYPPPDWARAVTIDDVA